MAINSHIQCIADAALAVYIFIIYEKKLSPIPPIAPSALKVKGNSEYEAPIFPPCIPHFYYSDNLLGSGKNIFWV